MIDSPTIRIADGPLRTDIRLPPAIIQAGRLTLYEDGWRIFPDWPSTETVIQRDDGGGLSAEEAAEYLDAIDVIQAANQEKHQRANAGPEVLKSMKQGRGLRS